MVVQTTQSVSKGAFGYFRQHQGANSSPTARGVELLQTLQATALREDRGLEPVTEESEFMGIEMIEGLYLNGDKVWEVRDQPFGRRRRRAA